MRDGPPRPPSDSSSSLTASGEEMGHKSSSERKALALSSESEKRADRLGHEGKAQEVLRPLVVEKEVLRGPMSRRELLGEGGGGGGREEGDGDEAALLLKPYPNHIVSDIWLRG